MKILAASWMIRWAMLFGVATGLSQTPAASATKAAAEQDPGVLTAERWIGRALIVRGFWAANDLNYDAAGRPIVVGKTTDWTLAGFDLQKVKRNAGGELELEGVRVAARWNPDQHIFERHLLKTETMRVAFPAPSAAGVETALAAIFSIGIDPALQRSMPPYWSHYFLPATPWPADGVTGKTIVALGTKPPDGMAYPQLVKKGEPGFTAEAAADHVKGTVRVSLDVDENGMPERVVVRQPLGYGLDRTTVEEVEKYRFKPVSVNGVAAVVEFVVNQTFE